jgi:hypothetical protein
MKRFDSIFVLRSNARISCTYRKSHPGCADAAMG